MQVTKLHLKKPKQKGTPWKGTEVSQVTEGFYNHTAKGRGSGCVSGKLDPAEKNDLDSQTVFPACL